jgi:O-antigen biosynthesis protein
MERKQPDNTNQEPFLATFKPVKILDIEVSQPLPAISPLDANGQPVYQRAMLLTRLHTYPLGLLTLDFGEQGISAAQLADHIWAKFGEQIRLHLQQDGFTALERLPEDGLAADGEPECLSARQALLEDAPLVSIVISTRERVQSLSKTLNSLLTLDYPKFEVILVDNAPKSDETHEFFNFIQPMFLRHNIGLRYVREDTPGLSLAHNRGLELVRTPFVAFTDDDVAVDKNWLAELMLGFKVAPSVGCVTGLVVPIELETPAQVLFEEYGGFVKGFDQRIYDLSGFRSDHPLYPYSPGHFGTGANMAYRTEFLKKSGGFDPALGIGTPTLGADDLVAFFQTLTDGNQLVYRPSAVIFHQHRRSYESLRKQMYGYGTGLTVFLFKCVLDNPKLFFDIAPKIPLGLKYAFAPSSPKNSRKSSSYPRELEWIERKGMLNGPIAYLISRWRYRKHKKSFSDTKYITDLYTPQHYVVSGWVDEMKGDKRTKEL